MRILYLSFFFPPNNTVGAVRVGKNAKYLAELGNELRVIAADGAVSERGDRSLPVEVPPEWVTYTPWWQVNAIGKSLTAGRARRDSSGAPNEGAAKGPAFNNSIDVLPAWLRGAGQLYLSVTNIPDAAVGWRRAAVRAAVRVCERWRPDVIYASGGPWSGLMAAATAARRIGVPWVAELRDPWAENHLYPFMGWRRVVDRWLERRTLSTAAGLVTVSEPMAQGLRRNHAQPVRVVLTGFDRADYPPPDRTDDDGRLHVVYTGQFYGGRCDPTPFFEAIGRLGSDAAKMRVTLFVRDDIPSIQRMVDRAGVGETVSIREPVAYSEALRQQVSADVLLLALQDSAAFDGVYTGKVFEYIGAGRPILAVARDTNVAAELIRSAGLGFASMDPAAIAEWLSEAMRRKVAGGLPAIDPGLVEPYSRLAQARVLEGFLKEIVGSSRTPPCA